MMYYKSVPFKEIKFRCLKKAKIKKKNSNFLLKPFRPKKRKRFYELSSGCENFSAELSIFAEIFSYTELRIQCIKH